MVIIAKAQCAWFCDVSRDFLQVSETLVSREICGLGHAGDEGQDLGDYGPARVSVLGHRSVDMLSCCW